MTILMHIDLPITAQQYDALNERLQKQGPEFFAGCLAHVAVADDGGVHVTDIWESTEAMEAFTERMMPFARELGLPQPEKPPTVSTAHNYWVPGM
ncbi:MAG: hypothetical protein HOV68_11230 [Streptomycetaceae bacterium]|nr:hypothetical protein [Streptomycetaceae bacterium]